MAGSYGSVYATPHSRYVTGARPHDMYMEMVQKTLSGGTTTVTLSTDCDVIKHASWAAPTDTTSNPAAMSVTTTGTTVVVNGATSATADIYVFGGARSAPRAFVFPSANLPLSPNSIHWELFKVTCSSGEKAITASSDLSLIARPLFVICTQVIATAPDTGGTGMNAISSIDMTLECGGASAVIAGIIGGYAEAATPADDTATDGAVRKDKVIHLGDPRERHPADLVGEFIQKTMDGASPAVVTITAADDCEFIKHIECVIPITTNATEAAISWSGTKGPTSALAAANATTDDVNCLVLGR